MAKLVMSSKVAEHFKAFRDYIRPQMGYLEDNYPCFITTTGQRARHVTDDIRLLAGEINETVVLGPTAVRKGTSSIAAGLASDKEKD